MSDIWYKKVKLNIPKANNTCKHLHQQDRLEEGRMPRREAAVRDLETEKFQGRQVVSTRHDRKGLGDVLV